MPRVLSRLTDSGKQALILTGVNSLFWFAWSFSSYQTVYLQQVGFSASQLGLLNALTSGVSIASLAFWGMISDKIGSLRKVLITVLVGGAVLFATIPLVPTGLPSSTILLLIWIPVVYFFRGSMSTYAENILVRNSNELRLNYGLLRSASSLLFTIGGLVISALLPFVGVPSTFLLSGVLMIPVVILTILAREPNARPASSSKKEKLDPSELFRNKAYVSFLIFGFLFYIANNCEASFLPYFIQSAGVPSDRYVVVLSYRALLEIPFLLLMVRLRRKFPLGLLVMASALFMAVECVFLGLFANSLLSIILCTTFFGLGNGLCIGSSLNYLYELAPAHLKASAQAFFSAVSSVAGILGNLGGGVIFDAIGAKPFYLFVSVLYFLSVGLFLLTQRKPQEKAA
ncbi:MAG: MFS transporter [Acutalibacter sp.]|jgi:PPP family 3-phenylpropionic acid transporter